MLTLSQINLYYLSIIIFVITFSAFILTLFYTVYYFLHRRHNKSKHGRDPRDIAVHEAVNIVDAARQKAMELLKEAQVEAKSILHDSS